MLPMCGRLCMPPRQNSSTLSPARQLRRAARRRWLGRRRSCVHLVSNQNHSVSDVRSPALRDASEATIMTWRRPNATNLQLEHCVRPSNMTKRPQAWPKMTKWAEQHAEKRTEQKLAKRENPPQERCRLFMILSHVKLQSQTSTTFKCMSTTDRRKKQNKSSWQLVGPSTGKWREIHEIERRKKPQEVQTVIKIITNACKNNQRTWPTMTWKCAHTRQSFEHKCN